LDKFLPFHTSLKNDARYLASYKKKDNLSMMHGWDGEI